MSREINRLNTRKVTSLIASRKVARHADGGGLYLSISPNGGCRWVFYYRRQGKQAELGLGSARTTGLKEARDKARDARQLLAEGKDPLAVRREKRAAEEQGETFGTFALDLVSTIEKGFRNEKHRAQWRTTLTTYAAPIWSKRLADIDTDDLLTCLKPIWESKPETANRVRGRIERVLDAAAARGLRSRENPARWRGHLANLLPKRRKLSRGHHEAMPRSDVPAFVAELQAAPSISGVALEFLILTAARSGEVRDARWDEIDLENAIWTVPAARMKTQREHRVPLSTRAAEIVRQMREFRQSEFVFPGAKKNKPLSVMALAMAMRRAERGELTVHGFRSTFRDWVSECTDAPSEVAEMALAHAIANKTEAAYRRGDLFEKRRVLMQVWCDYCMSGTSEQIG